MKIQLDQIRIASPCTASWDQMAGDDRSRFCGQCQLNVYNLSAMTQSEAQRLIEEKEGRVCVRLHKRFDGTVIVRDCPVGLAAVRRRTVWLVGRVAAGLALALGGFAWAVDYANPYRDRWALSDMQPHAALARWLREPVQQNQIMLGSVFCLPPPPSVPIAPVPSAQ